MNGGNSKSLLPLIEILISIGIFAIAVILTLQLFLLASFLGHKTSDTARAIFEVQNVAENIKSMKTNAEMENYVNNGMGFEIQEIDDVISSSAQGSYRAIFYDKSWNITDDPKKAEYMLKIDMDKVAYGSGNLYNFALELYKTEPYPFIDDKKIEKLAENENYVPLLVSINASKLILK